MSKELIFFEQNVHIFEKNNSFVLSQTTRSGILDKFFVFCFIEKKKNLVSVLFLCEYGALRTVIKQC